MIQISRLYADLKATYNITWPMLSNIGEKGLLIGDENNTADILILSNIGFMPRPGTTGHPAAFVEHHYRGSWEGGWKEDRRQSRSSKGCQMSH